MRPLLLIAGVAFILISSGASSAQCNFSKAVYRLPETASWELAIPHPRDDGYITDAVATLKYETGKTYSFGWSVSNGIGAEFLLPLPFRDDAVNQARNAHLRVYTFKDGALLNGLPGASDPAPEGLFIEGLDIHIRHADMDQLELPVGFWKFAGCK